jgi:hypothetical protein
MSDVSRVSESDQWVHNSCTVIFPRKISFDFNLIGSMVSDVRPEILSGLVLGLGKCCQITLGQLYDVGNSAGIANHQTRVSGSAGSYFKWQGTK